jgi:hypothetical protein
MGYGPGDADFESSMAAARAASASQYAQQAQLDSHAAQAKRSDPLNGMPVEGSFRLPRPIFSWVLFITLPLAAIVLFLPPNGKNVEIPLGVHQFLAIMVASIGSPLLRRFAIVLLALFGVLLLVGSLI